MKVLLILDFPLQTPFLAKFLLWSYCPKFPSPVCLWDSLKCNISKKMINQVNFMVADKYEFPTSRCYCFW